jgi:hypothetical protein
VTPEDAPPARTNETTIRRESFVSVRRRGLGSGPVATARLTDRRLSVGVPLTRYRLTIPLSEITRVIIDDGASLVRLHVWYLGDAEGGGIRLLVRNPAGWVRAFRDAGVDVAGDSGFRDAWNKALAYCYAAVGLGVLAAIVIPIVRAAVA